jgi:hypothetical protein
LTASRVAQGNLIWMLTALRLRGGPEVPPLIPPFCAGSAPDPRERRGYSRSINFRAKRYASPGQRAET